jgi:hypothetical protein
MRHGLSCHLDERRHQNPYQFSIYSKAVEEIQYFSLKNGEFTSFTYGHNLIWFSYRKSYKEVDMAGQSKSKGKVPTKKVQFELPDI